MKIGAYALMYVGVCIEALTPVMAQSTTSARILANVLVPITIIKTADMNFDNIAVQANLGGTVILSPKGGRTATGGVTFPVRSATVAAAAFSVGGSANASYSITLPSFPVLILNGSNTMQVTDFTSEPSGTGVLSDVSEILTVGATLHVSAGQFQGMYVSGIPFIVTVNYN